MGNNCDKLVIINKHTIRSTKLTIVVAVHTYALVLSFFFVLVLLLCALSLCWAYHIGSNFWKFYLNRTHFTLGESVSLVKVFRLFRLERIVLVFRVWTQYVRCTTSYLLAGPVCLWCLVSFAVFWCLFGEVFLDLKMFLKIPPVLGFIIPKESLE